MVRQRNDERERLKVGDPILKCRQILTVTSERCGKEQNGGGGEEEEREEG